MNTPFVNRESGLTAAEVEERRRDGRVNRTKASVSKPLSRIVFDNLFTLFNLVNAVIATALILVGSYHNLLFFGVVLCNSLVGIVQELRSKRALEKLSLLHAAKARVRRDGVEVLIALDDIVQDDRLLFQSGDQIAVDATVQSGCLEVNESLLTGEPDAIVKQAGDPLLSGSFVVGGKGEAIATRVGEEAYAAKLTAEAKVYKRTHSQLMTAVNKIIRFTGIFMIPFAALLVARDWFSGAFVLKDTVTATAAALIGMMPQGLILLTTVSLMVGVIKLAGKQTLVQELSSIESLSRVSLICLDKTGTITKGSMAVRDVLSLGDDIDTARRDELLAAAIRAIGDDNATARAISQWYTAVKTRPFCVLQTVPFSSERKWSAVSFEQIGTVVFGAFDRLMPDTPLPDVLVEASENGKRLILAAVSNQTTIDKAFDDLTPLAAFVVEDELRDNAAEIVAYFQNEDVTLRVISGDHPATVAAVAAKAGIRNAHLAVDATTLTTPEALRDAAARYVIFGRVSPAQKRELVRLFKEQGHTVAMTGDGVNDVPALKEADCSVAIAAGSDAAKQVSQLVLLNSDFSALPVALMEGRRVVNNITRTASLFLVKTVMSFLVTLCAIVLPMTYPFEPLQLTLVGVFAESIPGFFLTLEPSRERIKGRFLHTVLSSAVPSAVIITLFVVLTQLWIAPSMGLSAEEASTLCVYLTGFVWLVQLWRVCRPFTAARRVLWATMTVGFFGSALLLANILPTLFAAIGFPIETVFVIPTLAMLVVFLILAAVSIPLDILFCKIAGKIWRE